MTEEMNEAEILEFHTRWEHVEPRHVAAADLERFESYVAEILAAFGMDLATP